MDEFGNRSFKKEDHQNIIFLAMNYYESLSNEGDIVVYGYNQEILDAFVAGFRSSEERLKGPKND